jgi:hypothetical protein
MGDQWATPFCGNKTAPSGNRRQAKVLVQGRGEGCGDPASVDQASRRDQVVPRQNCLKQIAIQPIPNLQLDFFGASSIIEL